MIKQQKYLVVPIILSFVVCCLLGIIGMIRGSNADIKDLAIVFVGVTLFVYFLIGMIHIGKDIISNFFEANFKGKLLIILLAIGFLLRALYQIALSRG